jgi:hypothetical protein
MYSTMTRSVLFASMAAAFSRIEIGISGSVRDVLLLANMLPQQQPGMPRHQGRTNCTTKKQRRGGPRKLHFRQKRKHRS